MFEEYQKKKFESHSETIGEILSSMFSARENGSQAILKFIFTLALFGWSVDSVLPIIHDTSLWVFGSFPKDKIYGEVLKENGIKLIVPLGLFIFFAFLFYFSRRRNLTPLGYKVISSTPSKCLIYMLSTYSGMNKISLAELSEKIDNNTLTLNDLFSTNWGSLAFSIYFHSRALERIYLLTSTDAGKAFDEAKKVVEYVAKMHNTQSIRFEQVKIGEKNDDSNDISIVANAIKAIYTDLRKQSYNLDDVRANITGGTSAMSGGMILATLDSEKRIEYVRQGITLTEENIRSEQIMLEPKTTYRITK